MSNVLEEKVLDVHHWTDKLFTSREPAFLDGPGP